jgi:putative transcriptional regulator
MPIKGCLAPGLILASPQLVDPNFHRATVLIGHHDEAGALGWVLNGRELVPVRQLLQDAELVPPDVKLPDSPVFDRIVRVGGPVMPGSAWVLFEKSASTPSQQGDHELSSTWCMTGSRETMEAVARGEGPENFWIYLGYAGWGSDQIETEISSGAWLPAAFDPDYLTIDPIEGMWLRAFQSVIGTGPMAFSSKSIGSA